jgi:hypothetical protein
MDATRHVRAREQLQNAGDVLYEKQDLVAFLLSLSGKLWASQ